METRKATRSGPHAQNGLTIWRARKRAGLTQEQLAKASGISRIQMIKLENGMHLPKLATRDRLAEMLGVEAKAIRCDEQGAADGDPFRGPDDQPPQSRAVGDGVGKTRTMKAA